MRIGILNEVIVLAYFLSFIITINCLSFDCNNNVAKSNELINSKVKNTKYKYYMRKIVDKIFTSHQNLHSINSVPKKYVS